MHKNTCTQTIKTCQKPVKCVQYASIIMAISFIGDLVTVKFSFLNHQMQDNVILE